ncbi:MAG: hypothetical protein J6Z38_02630, partial [Lachnospiraceae bacterium]|nr:hypothetical protein [Lachnospiraceae bacterium]
MKLRELLSRTEYTLTAGDPDVAITGLSRDNRTAKAGDLFICTKGARFDTHDPEVVQTLAKAGVAAFLTERELVLPEDCSAAVVRVPNTREAGASVYAAWYEHPAGRMQVIGITGSKGKTTTAHMLYHVLKAAGRHPGIIGTNGVEYEKTVADGDGKAAGRLEKVAFELANTTPDYDRLQQILKDMADAGVDSCVLEVSSQAMKLHRCGGFTFDCGIFMNIQEGDHVGPNEHETFEDYMACKAALLNHSRTGLVNADDPYADRFLRYIDENLPLSFFSVEGVPVEQFDADGNFAGNAAHPAVCPGGKEADYRAYGVHGVFDEAQGVPGIVFRTAGKVEDEFRIPFPGAFNVWNALAAIAAADLLKIPADDVKRGLMNVHIKGRDDIVYKGRFSVCVDFAHNGASTRHH